MRAWMAFGTAAALLAACGGPVPDSANGVGFGDYAEYELERARREAALTGANPGALAAPSPVASAPIAAPPAPPAAPVPPGGIATTELAAAGIGVASAAPPVVPGRIEVPGSGALPASGISPAAPSAVTGSFAGIAPDPTRAGGGVEASPGNAAPALVGALTPPAPNASGISDEQDFDAVASRESIESDAQRRAANAAQYEVVQPQALPDAPADTGPNIVEYALAAPNARGQEWYSRFALSGDGRASRNCAAYRSPDDAQRDFLARGGPERDRRGIDPDGDGFACGWDPAPFLAAVGRG